MAVRLKDRIEANIRQSDKVNSSLSINGKTFNGSAAVDVGTIGAAYGGTGQTTLVKASNALLNALTTGSSIPQDADYYISQYVGGGTTTTTYHRRPMSALYSYIKGKTDAVYLPLTGGTITGAITANTASGKDMAFIESRGNVKVGMGIGSGNANHGIYSFGLGKWMVYSDGTSIYLNGNATTSTYVKATNTNSTNRTLYPVGNTSSSTTTEGALYKDADIRFVTRQGVPATTDENGAAVAAIEGYAMLTLGNSTSYIAAGGSRGNLRLYTPESYYVSITPSAGWTANRTLYVPVLGGTRYIANTSTTSATGGANQPVYCGANGLLTKCNSFVPATGGTFSGQVTVNGSLILSNCVEFYVDSSAGHGGYLDFHYNGSTADFTSRIIEGASGSLNINGTTFATNNVGINGGQIIGNEYNGGSWISGRSHALIKTTKSVASSSFAPIFSCKTQLGSWECGPCHPNEYLYFSYATDANFNANTNNTNSTVHIRNNGTLYGAVWNDYAEYRSQNEPLTAGYIAYCDDDGKLKYTTERLQKFEGVVSDTFGFAIGETDECKTPLAVSGRVLVYCDPEDHFHSGDCVCAGPDGKAYRMTREEITMYPDRIVGVVSEIPTYERWGSGNIEVNGRIWIKVK